MWLISCGSGSKPSVYFGWPPTDTVNSVRPWKDDRQDTMRDLCGPNLVCAYLRASFRAASLASAPELQKKARSAKVASTRAEPRRSTGSLV
jgi:hypothetical protein